MAICVIAAMAVRSAQVFQYVIQNKPLRLGISASFTIGINRYKLSALKRIGTGQAY